MRKRSFAIESWPTRAPFSITGYTLPEALKIAHGAKELELMTGNMPGASLQDLKYYVQ